MLVSVVAAVALIAIVVLCKIGEVLIRAITEGADRRVANVEEDRRALTAAYIQATGQAPAARLMADRERPERPQPPRIEGM